MRRGRIRADRGEDSMVVLCCRVVFELKRGAGAGSNFGGAGKFSLALKMAVNYPVICSLGSKLSCF